MPISVNGYRTEVLYRVREEVLGTTFYWLPTSTFNFTNAVPNLAKAMENALAPLLDNYGNDAKMDCVKAHPLTEAKVGWSFEQPSYRVGSAVTTCIDEMLHANLTLLSEFDEDTQKRITNRNQLAGLPQGDVNSGQVSSDIIDQWFIVLDSWITNGISNGGFTFIPACGRYQVGRWEFLPLERYKMSPFVGTRIDRIKNRPNTGKKPPVEAPADPV